MKIDLKQYKQKKEVSSKNEKSSSFTDILNKDIAIFPSKLDDKKKEQFYFPGE